MLDTKPASWEDQDTARLFRVDLPFVLPMMDKGAAGMLQKALDRADGKFGLYDLISMILSGHMTLWVVLRGEELIAAGITQILRFPKKVICSLPFVGGGNMKLWLGFEPQLMEWAKTQGASELEGYDVRAGSFMSRWAKRSPWLRTLTGWEPKYLVIRKPIP